MIQTIRLRIARLLASAAIAVAALPVTPMLGASLQATAQAQDGDSVISEFRTALSPYGTWKRHHRWGEVWVVKQQAPDWRPYTRGRWLYTNEWGWYWDVGPEEYAWGWVTYHYGRWANDLEYGWVWIPGEHWGPAWVDWRSGDDYVGWAPLPPDDLLVEYRDDPGYWSFVRPYYLLAPRVSVYCVPRHVRVKVIRRTVVVHRRHDQSRHHAGINVGIEPGVIARAIGRPIRAARVEPAVLKGTKVEGGREVEANQGHRAYASIRETNDVIRPGEKRDLGGREPARIDASLTGPNLRDTGNNSRRGVDDDSRPGNRRNGDGRRETDGARSPDDGGRSITVIRGSGREPARFDGAAALRDSRDDEIRRLPSQRAAAVREHREPEVVRPRAVAPPPVVRHVMPPRSGARTFSPPPQVYSQRRMQEPRGGNAGGNRGNNRLQDRGR